MYLFQPLNTNIDEHFSVIKTLRKISSKIQTSTNTFQCPKKYKKLLSTSFLVTCLADKTNHPVRRPKSQQIAVW